MPKFELQTLLSYDDAALIAEIHRVADLLPPGAITRRQFDAASRVSSSTLCRRLGGWRGALEKAGIAERYQGRVVTAKMRNQGARRLTDEELTHELHAAAEQLGVQALTMAQFNALSGVANSAGVKRRFGSWQAALERAGLMLSPLGRRYSDDAYFENILAVWSHYGRQPKYREMDAPPSTIPAGAYEAKFGGWRKALAAFVTRVNSHLVPPPTHPQRPRDPSRSSTLRIRTIPLGLRYDVLRRDRFKCVLCGASPATDPTCTLHIDHIRPLSRGGETDLHNLRVLCSQCNTGKTNKVEEGAV